MKSNLRLCLVLLAIVMGVAYFAPAAQAQQQRPGPPPSEVTPPQTPSETPSTREQRYTGQNQNDSITTPAIAPETYASESHVISWGSLIFGIIFGGFMGYVIGRQTRPAEVEEVRRDRDRAA